MVSLTALMLSLRAEGRTYEIAAPALFKIFSKKKAQLQESLQAELLAKTGLSVEQLTKPRPAAQIGDLTFDKADVGGESLAASPCEACQKPLSMEYFDVNGKPHCRACKEQVVDHFLSGSNWRFVPRALLYGTGAAIIGCLIYYGIRAATGYEVGLIAIVVGLMVGGAVRKASQSRGGPLFQTLAVGFTYTAIVFNYSPDLVKAMRVQATAPLASPNAAPVKPAPTSASLATTAPTPSAAKAVPPQITPAKTNPPSSPVVGPAVPLEKPQLESPSRIDQLPAPLQFIIGMAVIIALLYAIPFLGGASNVMGLFIIGIALYEAWKLNKRPPLNIAGPFQLRRS